MFNQSTSKKRVAAAATILSLAGAGLTMSGLSDGSIQIRAGRPDRPPEAAVTRASHDAIEAARVGSVARRVAWGRYTIERVTDTAASQLSAVSPERPRSGGATEGKGGEGANGSSRLPRKVVIGLPSYDEGRPPSATAPTVDRGTPPSVDPGWTTTVDLGEAPSVGRPSVDPGEGGTFHPPTVETD